MEQLWAEFIGGTHLSLGTIAVRLLGAAALGSLIGLEREWRDRPAGLKTHTVTALAAAAFAIITIEITESIPNAGDAVQADPVRIIEAVTAGVAFLAAGAIIQSRGQVHGLTTGAGMWLAGAIGVSIGFGQWSIGVLATLIGLFAVVVLGKLAKPSSSS